MTLHPPDRKTHDALRRAERARIRSELVTIACGILSVPILFFALWLYVISQ